MNIIKTIRSYKSDLFSALLLFLICSQAKFYAWEVPFTMQTFAVFLIGYFYDRKTIVLSVLLSTTILDTNLGNSSLFLYTVGYKIGFLLSGLLINQCKNKLGNLLLFSLSSIIVLLSGSIYLAFYVGDFGEAMKIGFLPFIIPETIKIIIAISVVRICRVYNKV